MSRHTSRPTHALSIVQLLIVFLALLGQHPPASRRPGRLTAHEPADVVNVNQ
jgi:hypothetical protein